MFAFFLESAFLGLFLYGEKRLSPRAHWWSAVAVFLGSWLSGYFIIATDAWMQHPVGYVNAADGSLQLSSFWELMMNPWAWWQYAHNMGGAAITGAFVMASVGAFYLLWGKFEEHGRIFVKVGVIAGLIFSVLQLFPTGDGQGRMIALNQPVTLAAMEALFVSQSGAPLMILGQPDVEARKIDNPTVSPRSTQLPDLPRLESECAGARIASHRISGRRILPCFITATTSWLGWGRSSLRSWSWRLSCCGAESCFRARWMLWILLLALPFPYIANTAGWMTAELGRQPWLVYGLMRTADGYSKMVSAGNGMFTLLGFLGMYTVLGILFLFLVRREIEHGPQ